MKELNSKLEQLSPYLPYGIWTKHKKAHATWRLLSIFNGEQLLSAHFTNEYSTVVNWPLEDMVPLLLDFSDLTKEVTIENEYAAHYCGKKIGDTVVPATIMPRCIWWGTGPRPIRSKSKHEIVLEGGFEIHSNWQFYYWTSECDKISPKTEEIIIALNTLRSLHFAIGFEMGEYIHKTTDQK